MRGLVQRLYPSFPDGRVGIALLVLRVVFGLGLMVHGYPKIQTPFSWMQGPNAAPPILQGLAAAGEFLAGAALVVGLFTPLAALGVIFTMLGAFLISHRNDPWINPGGRSWELASIYFTVALALLISGPGKYSLDALLLGKHRDGHGDSGPR
jgi:putative oxidoreductase